MKPRRSISIAFAASALVLALAGAASAQDPDEIRAKELQARIKKEMAAIDELLLQAEKSSPKEAREKSEAVQRAIDELLKDVQTKQSQVCTDIEELIRLAKYRQNKDGGGQSENPQSGDDPKNQSKPQERERDAEVEELKRQQEQQAQGEKDGKKPQGGKEPKSGEPDKSKGEQRDGEKPPGETGKFERDDVNGRWGIYPPKVEEIYQSLSPGEFPERYHKLLDRYFRRANEVKKKP